MSDPPQKRRSFLQRLTFSGPSSSTTKEANSAGSGSSQQQQAGKARSVSNPPQPSSSAKASSGGGGGGSNPFSGVAEGDEGGSGHASGVEEDEEDDGISGDDVEDEEDSSDMVAQAAQDFTSMRLSVAATGRNVSGSVTSAAAAAAALPPGTPASREELRVSACIVAAEATREKSGNGEYILYVLSVTTGSTAGLSWKVGRRFREFEALHQALCSKFGKDRFKLPQKALRRSLDPEYVRKKKTELAKYLTDLMLDPDVSASQEIAHFLVSSLQDVVRGSVENLRVFAARGHQLRELEGQLQRTTLDRARAEKERDHAARDAKEARKTAEDATATATAELARERAAWAAEKAALLAAHAAALSEAQSASSAASAALASSTADWEHRYNELAGHTKQALKDKKAALRAVQDLDALVKKLKAEKKILVKEVKENRARLAEFGALTDQQQAQGEGDAAAATAAAAGEEVDGAAAQDAAAQDADAQAGADDAAPSNLTLSGLDASASASPDLEHQPLGSPVSSAGADELAASAGVEALLESPQAGAAAEPQGQLPQLSTPAPVE